MIIFLVLGESGTKVRKHWQKSFVGWNISTWTHMVVTSSQLWPLGAPLTPSWSPGPWALAPAAAAPDLALQVTSTFCCRRAVRLTASLHLNCQVVAPYLSFSTAFVLFLWLPKVAVLTRASLSATESACCGSHCRSGFGNVGTAAAAAVAFAAVAAECIPHCFAAGHSWCARMQE